jgi:hypothetical protein
MKKLSVESFDKERAKELETVELIHEALDWPKSDYLDAQELRLLAEAKILVFSVLDNRERRGDILRIDYFRKLQNV